MNSVSERIQLSEKKLWGELSTLLFGNINFFNLGFSFRGSSSIRRNFFSSCFHKKINNLHLDYIEKVVRDSSGKKSGGFFSVYTVSLESERKLMALEVYSSLENVRFVLLDFDVSCFPSSSVLIMFDERDYDIEIVLHNLLSAEEKAKEVLLGINRAFWTESGGDTTALFNGVGTPIALLSKTLELRCLNSRFYEFITESIGLSIDERRFRVVSDENENNILNETLLSALNTKKESRCILTGETYPVFLTALPILPTTRYVDIDACLAVILKGKDLNNGEKQIDEEYFCFRWGLSNKEARVSELLVSDLSIDDIALQLNLSGETIRWYLKKLCSKFSVSGRLGFVHHVYNDFFQFIR